MGWGANAEPTTAQGVRLPEGARGVGEAAPSRLAATSAAEGETRSEPGGVEEPGGARAGASAGPPSVLLVDDNPGDRALYSELITDLQLEIREAASASQALRACAERLPSCVVVDYGLPGIDGIELVRRLRARYDASSLPIVVLTGRGDEGLAVTAMKAGASDYVSKQRALLGSELTRVLSLALARAHSQRLEQRLEQSERLAGLGQLAAGVAHEINNPASFVLVNLEHLASRLSGPPVPPHEAAELVSLCRDSIDGMRRITEIVREMHRFARIRSLEPEPVTLVDVVSAAIRLLAGTMRMHAAVETRFEPTPTITADRSKLLQVLVNLLDNAAKSLPESGGSVRVTTRHCQDRVQISVEDSGPGVEPPLREQIFEPFYTSRTSGLGLGLALCREYVRRHGGRIWVEASELGGACFIIELPCDTGLEVARRDVQVDTLPPPERRLRLLLVDDEPQILRAFKRALNPHCDVEVVDCVDAALAAIDGAEFDSVVCDVSMPGKSGVELYAWLRDHQPKLSRATLFCSGGILSASAETAVTESGRVLLQKPIEPLALLHAVRIAVEAARDDAS